MSNIANASGLVPIPDAYGCVKTKILNKAASVVGLLVGSPYLFSAGTAISVVAGASDNLSGAVVCLRNSAGKPVSYLAPADTGTVEVTYDKDQRYRMFMDGADFAVADGGKSYTLLAETATATSPTSLQMLDSRTEATIGSGQIVALTAIRKPNNTAGAAYVEVECYIDPTQFTQA